MKNLVTAIACVIVLSVFLVQITSYQTAHSRILYAETAVNAAAEEAKQDGCFTDENIARLQNKLAARLKCEPGEIVVTAPGIPVMRGSLIDYTVEYPLKHVIGAAKLLGIEDEANSLRNTIRGTVASEYIGR
ncbi:MAG: hypothetical protein HUJ80_03540 [Firmicutes bacterium]|nr:hypothetical protein [Bacillota bacterium]